jgi:hypothetical protein
VRARISRHREHIDIGRRDPAHLEAGAHRQPRKAGDVLDAAIAFFLDRRDQRAVAHERRRHIAVIRIEAENIHEVTGSSVR